MVVPEAAEEGAKDASAPLLLQADVALGCCGERQITCVATYGGGREVAKQCESGAEPLEPRDQTPRVGAFARDKRGSPCSQTPPAGQSPDLSCQGGLLIN